MSSACLMVKQTPLVLAPRSRPLMVDSRSPETESFTSLWRPWLQVRAHAHSQRNQKSCPYSQPNVPASLHGKPQAFQHPVRLFWPRSKSYDYLYTDGEALLKNFPVQATISFYEDSDSEEEEEEEDWEEEQDIASDLSIKAQKEQTAWN
ncbi:protein ripply1 [Aplochiton taeniatus]